MDFVWFAIIGVIAGFIAKAIMPGKTAEPQGCLMTSVLGMAGSLLVGIVTKSVLGWETRDTLIPTIIGATIGAIVILFVYGMVSAKSR